MDNETAISPETTSNNVDNILQQAVGPIQPNDIFSLIADELKAEKSLEKFKGKDINEFVKSHLNLEKTLGKRITEASKEELDLLNFKYGKPETIDGYEIPEDDIDPDFRNKFLERAFKANLDKDSAKILFEDFKADLLENKTKQEQQKAELLAENMKKITELFPNENERNKALSDVAAALKQYGGDEAAQRLIDLGILGEPAILKTLISAVRVKNEATVIPMTDIKPLLTAKEEAIRKIKEIESDRDHPFWNQSHPGHKHARDERARLYSIAYDTASV